MESRRALYEQHGSLTNRLLAPRTSPNLSVQPSNLATCVVLCASERFEMHVDATQERAEL